MCFLSILVVLLNLSIKFYVLNVKFITSDVLLVMWNIVILKSDIWIVFISLIIFFIPYWISGIVSGVSHIFTFEKYSCYKHALKSNIILGWFVSNF